MPVRTIKIQKVISHHNSSKKVANSSNIIVLYNFYTTGLCRFSLGKSCTFQISLDLTRYSTISDVLIRMDRDFRPAFLNIKILGRQTSSKLHFVFHLV